MVRLSTSPLRWRCAGVVRRALITIVWLAYPHISHAANEDFVTFERGSLPIIITAPHGGEELIPGVGLRGCGTSGVNCNTDLHTDLLADALRDAVAAIMGQAPYVVMGNVDRSQIDYNRPASLAYDDPLAAPFYDAYHNQIQAYVDEATARWGAALLLDLHGQSSAPTTIFRGTQNGATVAGLLALYGPDAITGPNSIFGQLADAGYTVKPDVNLPWESQIEDPEYAGGFTVQTYGAGNTDGRINAIQIEFGIDLRDITGNPAAIDDLAASMAVATATQYTSFPVTAIPEPSAVLLFGSGLILLSVVRRRRPRR
ncbi:MAG: N-formylglutamate amidohydrolase [Pirellulaceae bacterium]